MVFLLPHIIIIIIIYCVSYCDFFSCLVYFYIHKEERMCERQFMEQPVCSSSANDVLSTLLRPECLPLTIKQVIYELSVFLGCKISYTQSENINMQYEWCVLADYFAFLSASNWFSLLSHKHVTILFNCHKMYFCQLS